MTATRRACIGIGSNLGDPMGQVRRAARRLAAIPESRWLGISPLYRSTPLGPGDQPDYINAVAALDTALAAPLLLTYLHVIEAEQGRERRERWGARTLDLDLLLVGDECWHDDWLELPHPRLTERPFVLYPLYDLYPRLRLPNGRPLASLLATTRPTGLARLEPGNHGTGARDLQRT